MASQTIYGDTERQRPNPMQPRPLFLTLTLEEQTPSADEVPSLSVVDATLRSAAQRVRSPLASSNKDPKCASMQWPVRQAVNLKFEQRGWMRNTACAGLMQQEISNHDPHFRLVKFLLES
ncbi:hypothetical protein ABEF95_004507 [Exophiala dermatitidis]